MKRRRFFDFDEVFPDFGEIEKMFEEMTREMMDESKWRQFGPGKPLVYGFSMQVGPDGKPKFEEFGNVSPKLPTKIRQEREPLVDVIDGEREVTVIAELPGVHQKDLQLHAQKNSLQIGVSDPERRYAKQVKLPAEVDEKSARAKLKNGILEVVLAKLKPSAPKQKGREIKVE